MIQRSLWAVLGLAALIGGAFLWRQYLELVELRSSGPAVNERSVAARRLAEASSRVEELRRKIAAARTPEGATTSATDTPPAPVPQMNWYFSSVARELSNGVQKFDIKVTIDRTYAALFKRLPLTPAQVAEFKNLLSEKEFALRDAVSIARQQGLTGPPMEQVIAEAGRSVDQDIVQAIGPDLFPQFTEYEKTLRSRNTIGAMAKDLAPTPTPLTDQQVEQLVQILNTNHPPGALALLNRNTSVQLTPKDIEIASGVLLPPQLQKMEELRRHQQALQRVQEILSRPPGAGQSSGRG